MKRRTRHTQTSPSEPASYASQQACAETAHATLQRLDSPTHGLDQNAVQTRQAQFGLNSLPQAQPPGLVQIFLHQFTSPLVYVLLAAALVSLLLGDHGDALFIGLVLLLNAVIGLLQEFSAQKSADALKKLVSTQAQVIRGGETRAIDAAELVPGDRILLSSGERVPADVRLIDSRDLEVDESLLTGESHSVSKQADQIQNQDAGLAERTNCAFAGSLVNRGRAHAVVIATGMQTELGQIADAVLHAHSAKTPLQVRMEKFNQRITLMIGVVILILAVFSLGRGLPISEIFFSSVALAVAAIPEGLPVAMTVALAIGMRRMAKRHVIVRRLMAVEALGSCTAIATDKTGTLTVNQLTVRTIQCPDLAGFEVTGSSHQPDGEIVLENPQAKPALDALCYAAVLANEGILARKNGTWVTQGDSVDIALLIMAQRIGIDREASLNQCPEIACLPYESQAQFSASLNLCDQAPTLFCKGAAEKLLPMCTSMQGPDEQARHIDVAQIQTQIDQLTHTGYRVLAFARGTPDTISAQTRTLSAEMCQQLCFLGLVGIIDPLRPESVSAIAACHEAGIHVAMVTGDHPGTAFAIAEELNLCHHEKCLLTGPELRTLSDQAEHQIKQTTVFARVEPQQKLDIVRALQHQGHFVAVSGDGANDAPALRAAEVGVAMGKCGTDVARETADIIITNDHFDAIVAGIEEGRIAYANVRKVIFLLISTGCAELVLFAISLLSGMPLPLLPVQLLWLNLVSNGIQDVALAFEPREGDELKRPPRDPQESVFDRLMITRVILAAIVMGSVAFLLFSTLLQSGMSVEAARNSTLLLMVLFENVHVFNSRSERRSVFQQALFSNRFLLLGTLGAQGLHLLAMFTPGLRELLGVSPVSFTHWLQLFGMALSILVVMEMHKVWWRRQEAKQRVR